MQRAHANLGHSAKERVRQPTLFRKVRERRMGHPFVFVVLRIKTEK